MFIQHLASEAQNMARAERKPRRNIQYKDVAAAVSHHDNLEFLEDVVPKTSSYKAIKAQAAAARARVKGGSDVVVPPAGTAAAVSGTGPTTGSGVGVSGVLAAPEGMTGGVMMSLEQQQLGEDERDRMAMLPNAKKQKGSVSSGLQQTSIMMAMNGGLATGSNGGGGSIGGLAAPVNGLGAGGVNTGITNLGVTQMSSASGRPFSVTPVLMPANRGIVSTSPPVTASDEDPNAQLEMEMRQAASQQYRGHDGDVDMTG